MPPRPSSAVPVGFVELRIEKKTRKRKLGCKKHGGNYCYDYGDIRITINVTTTTATSSMTTTAGGLGGKARGAHWILIVAAARSSNTLQRYKTSDDPADECFF